MIRQICSNEPFSSFWRYNFDRASIFLAGPTPRSDNVKSWRPEAFREFDRHGFHGILFIPEPFASDYETQVGWEWNALTYCDLVLFWVPRELDTMPAFTTNVEFGMFVNSGKIIYGRPEGAPKTSYLDWHYKRSTKRNPCSNLSSLVYNAVNMVEKIRS